MYGAAGRCRWQGVVLRGDLLLRELLVDDEGGDSLARARTSAWFCRVREHQNMSGRFARVQEGERKRREGVRLAGAHRKMRLTTAVEAALRARTRRPGGGLARVLRWKKAAVWWSLYRCDGRNKSRLNRSDFGFWRSSSSRCRLLAPGVARS